ncbi:hypothetical protein HPP92_007676 [Vanilla planifolia]|uniref:Uncharacterized protein n=1 Tax=Vanilla planifolia TaxID=51239 RepID=A0A835RIM8_VANPL|nr:hypothetical protein HPP92_007676 [Vanilla planifolia]
MVLVLYACGVDGWLMTRKETATVVAVQKTATSDRRCWRLLKRGGWELMLVLVP